MIKIKIILALFFCLLIYHHAGRSSLTTKLELDSIGIQNLGNLIWKNECNGKKEGLTSWNEGEEFASLGIGHFIWFPEGQTIPFQETFPDLLKFFQKKGISLPLSIKNAKGCPWRNREEFKKSLQDPAMIELREWLYKHVATQALFMVERLQKEFPLLLARLPKEKKKKISFQFYRVAAAPGGLYALIDYFNFKGAGAATSESYQGCGWGLLQVLEGMQGSSQDLQTIQEFVSTAKMILDRRISLAPPLRKEERWRAGWFNRLDSYNTYAENRVAL